METENLRQKLLDYVGTAAFSGFPAAFGDLIAIEQANEVELKEIAKQLNVNVED